MSTEYSILLGRAIRDVREQHGLSAHDLAAAAGVAPARVAALEDGQLDPDFELLVKLAESMGTHPAAFALRARELGGQDAEGRG
ncbi:MAG: helix-turn-helix domain-containing protein [Solirubrobacteraceae bacterium]